MPIFDESQGDVFLSRPLQAFPGPIPEEGATIWQKFGAAFRQENSLVSAWDAITDWEFVGPRKNLDFNPFDELVDTKYEPFMDRLADADNPAELEILKRKIDSELEDKRILNEGGGLSILTRFVAGALDPINFIPIGGMFIQSARGVGAARGAAAFAKAAGKGAVTGAIVGAVGAAISETTLAGLQETRDIEEVKTGIGAGALFGGILGGAARSFAFFNARPKVRPVKVTVPTGGTIADFKVTKEVDITPEQGFVRMTDGLTKDLTINDTEAGDALHTSAINYLNSDTSQPLSVPFETSITADTITGTMAEGLAKVTSGFTPETFLLNSPSATVRGLYSRLADQSFFTNRNFQDEATAFSVETKVRTIVEGLTGKSTFTLKELFKQYEARVRNKELAPGEVRLDFKNFKEQASRAARRNDAHPISEVRQASEVYRKNIFRPVGQDAVTHKVIDGFIELPDGESFLPRIYARAKILADRVGFIDALKRGFRSRDIDLRRKFDSLKKNLTNARQKLRETPKAEKQLRKEIEDEIKQIEDQLAEFKAEPPDQPLTDEDYTEIAELATAHILKHQDGLVRSTGIGATKGLLRNRKLDIETHFIEDFLENDIDEIARRYTRAYVPEIELRKTFGDDIDEAFEGIKRQIREEYDELMVDAADDPKKIKELNKRFSEDEKYISALIARLRGTPIGSAVDPDSIITQAALTVRTWNFTTSLGGLGISQLPDFSRIIQIDGFTTLFSTALDGVIANKAAFRMATEEALEAGAGWNVVLNESRALKFSDIRNPVYEGNKVTQGMQAFGNFFSSLSLAPRIDDARIKFASVIAQRRTLRTIDKAMAGQASKKEIAELRRFGISKEMQERISTEWKRHGEIDGKIFIANTKRWADQDAVFTYRAALNHQLSFYSTTPSIGTMPLWMDTEIGKTFGQFMSFMFAANNKILIAGLQQPDARMMSSLAANMAMSMMVYAYKEIAAGRELPDDPREWIAGGVDESGIFGVLAVINDYTSDLTGGLISARRALLLDDQIRPIDSTRDVARVLGPSFSKVADFTTLFKIGNPANNWSERDTRAIRRLIPMQNLFYIRFLFDRIESRINKHFHIRPTRRRRRRR